MTFTIADLDEYKNLAVATTDDLQVIVRIHDLNDQGQVQRAMKALFLGLNEVCSPDELEAVQREMAVTLEQYRKEHPDANRQEL